MQYCRNCGVNPVKQKQSFYCGRRCFGLARSGINKSIVCNKEVCFVPLSQGYKATIDVADYELVNRHIWSVCIFASNRPYTQANNGRNNTISMHRLLLNAKPGQVVDHINGDALDNRRKNLRICLQRQNSYNSSKRAKTTSKYKGVSPCGKKWRAYIAPNRRQINLGVFAAEKDAAKAYNDAAIKYFAEYAHLNEV